MKRRICDYSANARRTCLLLIALLGVALLVLRPRPPLPFLSSALAEGKITRFVEEGTAYWIIDFDHERPDLLNELTQDVAHLGPIWQDRSCRLAKIDATLLVDQPEIMATGNNVYAVHYGVSNAADLLPPAGKQRVIITQRATSSFFERLLTQLRRLF